MKEVTLVLSCQITSIATVSEEDADLLCDLSDKRLRDVEKQMKDDLGVDDVLILDHKAFVMDAKEDVDE